MTAGVVRQIGMVRKRRLQLTGDGLVSRIYTSSKREDMVSQDSELWSAVLQMDGETVSGQLENC